MPKNKGRGGKKFRSGKKGSDAPSARKLEFKEDGQEYAKVTKILGNRRIMTHTNDGKNVMCIIPGKFKKRVWINVDDIILITVRSYQDDKSDVIYKYLTSEVKQLIKMNEIDESLVGDLSTIDERNEIAFESDNDESEEEGSEEVKMKNNIDIDLDDL